MEDFIAALPPERLPLAVAMNEVVASLVSGTGLEHNKERQARPGNFLPAKSQTGHPLCSTSGEITEEQSSIQVM